MMTLKSMFPKCLLAVAIGALTLFSGCGGDESAKEKTKPKIPRIALLSERLAQLDSTLDSMQKDSDIQQRRIAAAKADLDTIQEEMAKISKLPVRVAPTSATALLMEREAERHGRNEIHAEKDKEGRPIFRALLMMLFTALVIIYVVKLWRQRTEAPDTPEDMKPWQPSPHEGSPPTQAGSSFTYNSPPTTENQGGESTSYHPPADTEKNEGREHPPAAD